MRKLKSIVVMILILDSLLLGTIIGLIVTDKINSKKDNVIEEEEIVEDTIPDTFVANINNKAGVPKDIVELITDYNDDYYLSIYKLEEVETSSYFDNDIMGAISDDSIKLIVESRKLYDFDFTLSKAYYDLTFTSCVHDGEYYYIDFLIDDYMNFAFLGDICSESYDIENSMTIKNVDGVYKIVDYDKTQGYYMMFYDNEYNSVSDVEEVYDYYFNKLSLCIENENYLKSKIVDSEYIASKTYDVAYDRQKAVAYANKYAHLRNDDWYDYSDEGGNCQNFASQCLIAGDMIMDYSGNNEWYYDYPSSDGRTVSWVQVPGFYNYCDNNSSGGLVADCDANLFYGEAGDIVQVGISSITHTTIISQVVDGHILLNSNSIDMKNWPLEAYTYPTRKLIKILGSNY